eukprot:Hpha_TRINITY_DN16252_c0_g15::TRINITY_DN16252_c0_g15_i1::g.14995::m.14995/K08582/CAPN15; calpain-15
MPEKKQVKDGLLLEEKPQEDGTKMLVFENTTVDKQFIVKYGFKGATPDALGITRIEGEKWILSIHPGETQEFVKGKWSGTTKAISTGPPSKEWQEKKAGAAKEENAKEFQAVKELCKEAGVKETAPSEEVAALCEKKKLPFVDLSFPPLDESLQAGWQAAAGEMKMFPFKRPSTMELLRDKGLTGQLFVDKIEPSDVNQGALADCYLMGAMASVAVDSALVKDGLFGAKQVPELGIFRVWLCKDAWWQLITIDDFLPCSGPKPAFARNRDEPNEMWVGLVEKAYSKASGSFFAMKTGQCNNALGDLVGCPHRTEKVEPTMWDAVVNNEKLGFLQVLGTSGKNLMYVDEKKQSGADKELWDKYRAKELICEHSYSLLGTKVLKNGDKLVCIRNPWGNTEHGLWNGKYGPNSDTLTDDVKKELGIRKGPSQDGVFWMLWEDAAQWFGTISIGFHNRKWTVLRAKINAKAGCSDLMAEILVTGKTRMWVGYHQQDIRGHKPGTPEAAYCAINMFVVDMKKDGTARLVESATGFKRDGFKELLLEPKEGGKETKRWVILQPKDPAVTKQLTVSYHVEDISAVKFTWLRPEDPKTRYETAKDVRPDQWAPAEAEFQLGKELKKAVSFGGDGSSPKAAKAAPAKHADPSGSPAKGLKAKDTADLSAAASSPKVSAASRSKTTAASSPASAAKKLLDRELSVEVRVISANGLSSKGSNNPFCEVKLREVVGGKVGDDHSSPQKQQTKVIQKELNPVWDEKFRFTVPGSDCIRISVFGKKMMGKDFLGRVDLMMPSLAGELTAGGPEVKKQITIAGEDEGRGAVSGTMEVGVRLLAIK